MQVSHLNDIACIIIIPDELLTIIILYCLLVYYNVYETVEHIQSD